MLLTAADSNLNDEQAGENIGATNLSAYYWEAKLQFHQACQLERLKDRKLLRERKQCAAISVSRRRVSRAALWCLP